MSKRTVFLLVAAIILAVGAFVWTARGPASATVETGVVKRQERFRSAVTASGEIVATRYADISSDVMGKIVKTRSLVVPPRSTWRAKEA